MHGMPCVGLYLPVSLRLCSVSKQEQAQLTTLMVMCHALPSASACLLPVWRHEARRQKHHLLFSHGRRKLSPARAWVTVEVGVGGTETNNCWAGKNCLRTGLISQSLPESGNW